MGYAMKVYHCLFAFLLAYSIVISAILFIGPFFDFMNKGPVTVSSLEEKKLVDQLVWPKLIELNNIVNQRGWQVDGAPSFSGVSTMPNADTYNLRIILIRKTERHR